MADLTPDQFPDGWTDGAAGYEESFAPFTGVYADEALRLLGVGSGDRLLDVAAGSGALSLRAARLGATVLATDFAEGMVALVGRRLAEEDHTTSSAEVMDGQALEVDDAAFDYACSMFGVIFFPDIAAGLSELRRAVRSGGKVCVATWRLDGFRLLDLVVEAITRAVPAFEAPGGEPAWARIGDAAGLSTALSDADLVDVEVHTVTRSLDLAEPAEFFRRMPSWAPPAKPLFDLLEPAVVDRAAQAFVDVVADASGGEGGVDADALIGIARRA